VSQYALLKDLKGHIAGYVRADEANAYFRIQLGFPVQTVMIFSDGSQKESALNGGMTEQAIACDGKKLRGCYVLKEEKLLLISDETMRKAYERRALSPESGNQKLNIDTAERQETILKDTLDEKTEKQRRAFPQSRWPQPPCWDTALYAQGRWQETAQKAYSDP